MATKTQAPVYVGGDEPEAVQKRQAYEQALERLSKSLEARQQQMFDPALLGAAAGFLTPGKTGSFWESLGSAASGYAKGEQESQKQAQEIAQAQMEAASAGLQIERQKMQDQAVRQMFGLPTTSAPAQPVQPLGGKAPPAAGALQSFGPQVAPVGALQAAAPQATPQPAGGLQAAAPQAAPQAPSTALPISAQYGAQMMPPDPTRITGKKFAVLNMNTMPLPDLLKEAARIDAENMKTTEGGTVDLVSGRFYPSVKGDAVERTIYDYGGPGKPETIKVAPSIARALDAALDANDPAAYAIARERAKYGFAQTPAGQPTTGAPSAGQPTTGAPSAGQPTTGAQPLKSVSETALEAEKAKKQVVGREDIALEKEKALGAQMQGAQRGFQAASDTESIVKRALKEKRDPFGVLSQPGIANAVLGAVSQGLTTPGGSISIPQLEQAVVQASGSAKDIADRKAVARNSAELLLAFRRMYMQGQGAISNSENAVVGQLAGSELDTSANLLRIMKLLKERYQYEIDEQRNWLKYKKANKGSNYLDFEESDDFLARRDAYDRRIGKMFGTEPATPTEQKTAPAQKAPAGKATPEAVEAARKRLRGLGG